MADEDTSVATESAPSDGGGIKSASEVIEKVLAKEAPEPAAKVEAPAPAAEKKPARRVEKLEAKAAEKAATAEAPPEPEADASALEKARFHLKHGDVAKFIDTVLGDFKADGIADGVREALARKLGVSSAQWEKVRKYEQNAKRTLGAREQELSTVVERLKSEYAPFHEARSLYAKGDFDAAFKAAFGEDAADYQRKVITQRVGKNPEIEALKAQLEERDRKQAEREQAQREAADEADRTRQIHAYLNDTQAQCLQSDDAAIRKYSSRPAFIQRIYAIQKESYDEASNTLMPLPQAAEMARDEILQSLQQWRVDDDSPGLAPAKTAQASALPAKPPVAKAPVRALKQSQAAEGTGQPQKLTPAEVRAKYQRMMENASD